MTTATKTATTYPVPCPADGCDWTTEVTGVRQGRADLYEHSKTHGGLSIREVVPLVSAAAQLFRGNNQAPVGDTPIETGDPSGPGELVEGREIRLVRLFDVDPNPFQTRSAASMKDGLEDLAESIRVNGQEVPVRVRRKPGQPARYEMAYGHRRHAALMLLQSEDPSIERRLVAEVVEISNARMAQAVLLENYQRKDLKPLELARGIKAMLSDKSEAVTQSDVAKILGVKQPTVANWLRAIDTLPKKILEGIESERIDWSAGRPLYAFRLSADHAHTDDMLAVYEMATAWDNGEKVSRAEIESNIDHLLTGDLWHVPEALKKKVVRWKPLDDTAWSEAPRITNDGYVKFDAQEYHDAAPGMVHNFGKLGAWACDSKAWETIARKYRKPTKSNDSSAKRAAAAMKVVRKHVDEVELPKVLKQKKIEPGPGFDDEARKAAMGTLSADIVNADRLTNLENSTDQAKKAELPEGVTLKALKTYGSEATGSYYQIPILRKPDGSPVALVSKWRPAIDRPGECNTCTKGRCFGFSGNEYGYGSMPKKYDAPVPLCANMTCLLSKAALKLSHRIASEKTNRASESELANQLARTVAVGGLTREVKTYLIAAFAQSSRLRPTEHYQNSGRLIEWLLQRLDTEDLVITSQTEVDPAKLAEVLAEKPEEWLDETLAEMARVAVTDNRTGYVFEPVATGYMRLAMPAGSEVAS